MVLSSNDNDVAHNVNENEDDCNDIVDDGDDSDNCSLQYFSAHVCFIHFYIFYSENLAVRFI